MSYEARTDLDEVSMPKAPVGVFGRIVDGLNAVGSIVIAAVMLLMCADVLLRNLANRPIEGVAELVATSIIVIVFLQLPATVRHDRMSRADLFLDPFSHRHPTAGRRLNAAFSLAGAFALAIIAYASWPLLTRAIAENDFLGIEGVFTFPLWPMRAAVVVGAGLAALQYLVLFWGDLRRGDAP